MIILKTIGVCGCALVIGCGGTVEQQDSSRDEALATLCKEGMVGSILPTASTGAARTAPNRWIR